jgi:hypothetical protein
MNVKRNETVKIYCETVQENLKPTWYHNELLIETVAPPPPLLSSSSSHTKNSNKECFSAGTQHLLIINDISDADAGKYKLKFGADHEYYTEIVIETSGNYDLVPRDDEPHKFRTEILQNLQNVKCSEGDEINLEITLNRSLKDNDLIEWKKNGQFLVNSIGANNNNNSNDVDNVQFVTTQEKCALTIKNCTKNDSGQYEMSLIELDAHKEPVVVKSKCSVNVVSYVEKSEILKQLPRMLKITEGDNIRLDCSLDKQPDKLNWYHNSVELVPQQAHLSQIEMSSLDDGRLQILEIKNVQLNQHEGTYRMHADDKVSICEVKIKPSGVEFVQKPPELILHDINKELEMGNDIVRIEAIINKSDAQIKWFKGNEQLFVDDSE